MSCRLFLAGDVMTGRGIDQILTCPSSPELYEGYMRSAVDYVTLAEARNGPIPRAVPAGYVWGDLLADLAARDCDFRIVNLETAITTADRPEPKGINYRMHPDNIGVLSAAGIDACILANNHVLDWGTEGLVETLDVLDAAGIGHAGAGRTRAEALAPCILTPKRGPRILLMALGCQSAGVPADWAAGADRPGIALLPPRAGEAAALVQEAVAPIRRPGDLLVVSLHRGPNWGYAVPETDRALAHTLIGQAGVDIVFGHSSHHPIGADLYRDRLILYGAGDLINDYEGIGGQEEFRPDLAFGYVVDLDQAGALTALTLLPYRRRRFRLERAGREDARWLAAMMEREGLPRGQRFDRREDGSIRLARGSAT